MTGERRIESATSRTAQMTCISRAFSYLESDRHYHSDDDLAVRLLPDLLGALAHISLFRTIYRKYLSPAGIYEYVIARTKFIDGAFAQALTAGIDQVLLFGAGFDTRALRFQAQAGSTTLFELDVPITQQAKLGQYVNRGVVLPSNVVLIAIDFDRESLPDRLHQAGFRKGQTCLFVLEGLLMYLQPASVDETFRLMESLGGRGSQVVFDYVRASVLRGMGDCYGERAIVRSVSKAGEGWQFGLEPGELEGFLGAYGLTVREHLDAAALERRYFTNDSGALLSRINGTHCLVRAEKTGGI